MEIPHLSLNQGVERIYWMKEPRFLRMMLFIIETAGSCAKDKPYE